MEGLEGMEGSGGLKWTGVHGCMGVSIHCTFAGVYVQTDIGKYLHSLLGTYVGCLTCLQYLSLPACPFVLPTYPNLRTSINSERF